MKLVVACVVFTMFSCYRCFEMRLGKERRGAVYELEEQ